MVYESTITPIYTDQPSRNKTHFEANINYSNLIFKQSKNLFGLSVEKEYDSSSYCHQITQKVDPSFTLLNPPPQSLELKMLENVKIS